MRSILAGTAASLLWIVGCGDCSGPRGHDAGREDGDIDSADAESGDADTDTDDADVEGGPITLVGQRATVVTEMVCDVDGDGEPDNILAELDESERWLLVISLNEVLGSSIRRGTRVVAHVPWCGDLFPPFDPDMLAIAFAGEDADEPDDTSDDFSGTESYLIRAEDLDGCGEPRLTLRVRVIDGLITTLSPLDRLPISGVDLSLRRVDLSGRLEPFEGCADPTSCAYAADLTACGYASAHDLGHIDAPIGSLNALEGIVSGAFFSAPGLQPDIDVDGDGHERFELDETGQIVGCIDGNGTVSGTGRDCWDDPDCDDVADPGDDGVCPIMDGFSLTLWMRAVPAVFGGREPGWEEAVQGGCDGGPPDSSLFDPS